METQFKQKVWAIKLPDGIYAHDKDRILTFNTAAEAAAYNFGRGKTTSVTLTITDGHDT